MTKPNKGKRVMPLKVTVDTLSDEGDFLLYDLELTKNKKFSYLVYGYLQQMSYSDKESRREYRKVYTDEFSIRKCCKALKMGDQKVQKHLAFLRENGFLSTDTYQDPYGTYYKLPVLECSIYTKLDFEKKCISQLFNALNEDAIKVFLTYKAYCDAYDACYLTIEQICDHIGLSHQGYSYKKIKDINATLVQIGLIRYFKIPKENGEGYSHKYICYV